MRIFDKSKLNEMAKSFKDGAQETLTDKGCILIAAFTGALCSDGSIIQGITEGAKILGKSAVLNGVVRVGIDQVFPKVEEELTED